MGLCKRTYEARYLVFGGTLFLTWDSKVGVDVGLALALALGLGFFSSYFFHFLSLIFRARPCPSHLAALLFCFRVSLPILSPVSEFFMILGLIREFISLLSPFCRGAATLLQDVYQNVTTIKL